MNIVKLAVIVPCLMIISTGSGATAMGQGEPCTTSNKIGHVLEVDIPAGPRNGAYIERADGATQNQLLFFSPICEGDKPFAKGKASIKFRLADSRVIEVTQGKKWGDQVKEVQRSSIFGNVLSLMMDKLITNNQLWASPQRARGDDQGTPAADLPGISNRKAVLWFDELGPVFQIPVARALELNQIEIRFEDDSSGRLATMVRKSDRFEWAGKLPVGRYSLIGVSPDSASNLDLGGFDVVAGTAPKPDGYPELVQFYGMTTALGLRAAWLADVDPSRSALMAYQLAQSATLEGADSAATQRAVITLAGAQ